MKYVGERGAVESGAQEHTPGATKVCSLVWERWMLQRTAGPCFTSTSMSSRPPYTTWGGGGGSRMGVELSEGGGTEGGSVGEWVEGGVWREGSSVRRWELSEVGSMVIVD